MGEKAAPPVPDEVIIVASTHWDREWYHTFHETRVRLCELINRLLPLLENGTVDCYTFDGQSVVLEDYLEVCPENRDRIAGLVREGRLVFGPLYNLPDEFLSGGEALIRNFIAGDALCASIGGKCRAVYVPDNFGHISQLPQIIRGVGMGTVFFFRGLDLREAGYKEFRWQSPDGSEVLGEYLSLGYWSLKSWGRLGKTGKDHFLEACRTLHGSSALGCVLLINGSDHLFQDPELPRLIAEARAALPGVSIRNAGLDDYARLLTEKAARAGDRLGLIRGELRDFRAGPDPNAAASSHSRVKARFFETQGELLRWAEPLAAWAWASGFEYPGGLLDHAWKDLLKALDHGGITGTSSDTVMEDIALYLRHSRETASAVAAAALLRLFPQGPGHEGIRPGADHSLLVFNPLHFEFSGVIEAEVCLEDPEARDFTLSDEAGRLVEWEYLSSRRDTITREFEYNSKEKIHRRCFRIRFQAEQLRPFAFKVYTVKTSPLREFRQKELAVRLGPSVPRIENEYYLVEPRPDTALRISLKENGLVYDGLNLLVSRGEAGDTYQYVSPLADEHTYPALLGFSTAVNSPLSSELRIEGELRIPRAGAEEFLGRDDERVRCPFETRVLLYRQSRRIEIRTVFDNRGTDHALFAVFPLPFAGEGSFSQIAFDEVRRGDGIYEFRPDLKSTQSILYPFEGYAGVREGDRCFALSARGLYEYHTKKTEAGRDFYLTLMRSTSWMFHGLPHNWLDGQHSTTPLIETPGAAEYGKNVFNYALFLDTGDLQRQADRYRCPPRCYTLAAAPAPLPPAVLPDLSPLDRRIGFSALKKWRFGEGLLIRFFNTSAETAPLRFGVGAGTVKASTADLLETPLEALALEEGFVSLTIGPRRIITIILHRG
jgi:alpha-mannosidase